MLFLLHITICCFRSEKWWRPAASTWNHEKGCVVSPPWVTSLCTSPASQSWTTVMRLRYGGPDRYMAYSQLNLVIFELTSMREDSQEFGYRALKEHWKFEELSPGGSLHNNRDGRFKIIKIHTFTIFVTS